MRSRVQIITPAKAAAMLAANTANRPLSKSVVRVFAEAMRRGEWLVTHQGIAFDVSGVLVDGQHRLAAIMEAGQPVDVLVVSGVDEATFDVLDVGKRRNAADVLAIEGEKYSRCWPRWCVPCGCTRTGPTLNWSSGSAGVSNHQIVATLARHPKLRDFVKVGERISTATGMIKSAAGASLPHRTGQQTRRPDTWYDGIIDGAGLSRRDPRLLFRRVMFNMARRQAGQPMRRRYTREHVALYLRAFNAWHTSPTTAPSAVHPRRSHALGRHRPLSGRTDRRKPRRPRHLCRARTIHHP